MRALPHAFVYALARSHGTNASTYIHGCRSVTYTGMHMFAQPVRVEKRGRKNCCPPTRTAADVSLITLAHVQVYTQSASACATSWCTRMRRASLLYSLLLSSCASATKGGGHRVARCLTGAMRYLLSA